MAKKVKNEESTTEELVQKLDRTALNMELFLEKNAKVLGIVIGVVVLAALGYFAYLKLIVDPKSDQALKEMVTAERLFEQDSIGQALNGSKGSYLGLQQIVDEYGNTDAGNLAKLKAGAAYYKLGDYTTAIKMFEDFSTKDPVLLAQKYGMIGNCLVQTGKVEEGLPYYVKAAEATKVVTIEQTYYTKAGNIAMSLGKNEDALKYFQIIVDKYPGANNNEAEKFVERLTYALGQQ